MRNLPSGAFVYAVSHLKMPIPVSQKYTKVIYNARTNAPSSLDTHVFYSESGKNDFFRISWKEPPNAWNSNLVTRMQCFVANELTTNRNKTWHTKLLLSTKYMDQLLLSARRGLVCPYDFGANVHIFTIHATIWPSIKSQAIASEHLQPDPFFHNFGADKSFTQRSWTT